MEGSEKNNTPEDNYDLEVVMLPDNQGASIEWKKVRQYATIHDLTILKVSLCDNEDFEVNPESGEDLLVSNTFSFFNGSLPERAYRTYAFAEDKDKNEVVVKGYIATQADYRGRGLGQHLIECDAEEIIRFVKMNPQFKDKKVIQEVVDNSRGSWTSKRARNQNFTEAGVDGDGRNKFRKVIYDPNEIKS